MSNKWNSIFLISKSRKRRQRREKKNRVFRPFAFSAAALSSLLLVGLAFWGINIYSNTAKNLPSIDLLPLMLEPSDGNELKPIRVFGRDGEHLLYSHQNPNAEGAQYIPYKQIPEDLIQSVLLLNSPRYFESPSIGFPLEFKFTPITESVISRFLLPDLESSENSIFIQNIISLQVENKFGKEKILEWFLNSSYFGNHIYGIDRASRAYFGKSVTELNLAESAMMAAILRYPSSNPQTSLVAAKANQKVVLSALVQAEYINSVQAEKAEKTNFDLLPITDLEFPIAEEYIKLILDELPLYFSEAQINHGGIDIISSLDFDLQQAVECTTEIQMNRISANENPEGQSGQDCEASRLLPVLGINDISISDEINSSVVIMDSHTGGILAYYGNPENLIQAGTIISPFIYMTAFTRGFSPADMIWDIPSNNPLGLENYLSSSHEYLGPVRMRTALVNDLVTPALQTLTQVGIENVWFTANNSGINNLRFNSGSNPFETIFNDEVINLLELTHAYTLFSNNGNLAGTENMNEYSDTPAPLLTRKIISQIPLIEASNNVTTAIISPEYTYLITDVLADDVNRNLTWNAGNSLELAFDSAVMTSAANNSNSQFIIGYSSEITIGVWAELKVDNQSESSLSKYAISGLWNALMRYAHFDSPPEDFWLPDGISKIDVCSPSGMLPSNNCQKIVTEVFISGTEPKYPDTFYKSIQINEITGKLATATTPPELIIDRIYMSIPEDALKWALDAGVDIPPSDYDLAYLDSSQNNDVKITSPDNFNYISGQVDILGSAAGDDFSSYKLEYGQGISPQEWLQIGDSNQSSITDDVLTIWDTIGLDGLYALRLQVINSDYSIHTDVIQVSLDNTPPHLMITYPENDYFFVQSENQNIPIQISVNDNISIEHVEFFVNGELIADLIDPPFTYPWNSEAGNIQIEIIAYDFAGNSTIEEVTFTVE